LQESTLLVLIVKTAGLLGKHWYQRSHEISGSLAFTNNMTGLHKFIYRAFHQFGQAKFPDGGSILGSSQFTILPQLPLKTILGLKVVKIDSKINNSLC